MTLFERFIVFLFIFSLVSVALNASGIFNVVIPTQDMSVTTAKIEEISSDSEIASADDSPFGSAFAVIGFLGKAVDMLKGLTFSVLDIDGLLRAYHFPDYSITIFYSVMVLLSVFMFLKWLAQRN